MSIPMTGIVSAKSTTINAPGIANGIFRSIRTCVSCNFAYGLLVWVLHFKGFQIGEMPSLYHLLISPITSGHQFMYNLAGWFVAPLFMAEVFYLVTRKLLSRINDHMPEWVF